MGDDSREPEIGGEAHCGASAMPRRLVYLVLALLALGVALRVRAYVHKPPLWLAEASLALDIQ